MELQSIMSLRLRKGKKMSKLVSIWELPIVEGKSLCKESANIHRALHKIKHDGKIGEEEFEDTVEMGELLLALYDVVNQYEKRRGNSNATK